MFISLGFVSVNVSSFLSPSGTRTPMTCIPGFVINRVGAAYASECDVCPAGLICPLNAVLPQPCTQGHYCPYNETIQPCPRLTYNDRLGGSSLLDCRPCQAGFYCDNTGMAHYDVSPCPPGYYCPEATHSPIPCPSGTYR